MYGGINKVGKVFSDLGSAVVYEYQVEHGMWQEMVKSAINNLNEGTKSFPVLRSIRDVIEGILEGDFFKVSLSVGVVALVLMPLCKSGLHYKRTGRYGSFITKKHIVTATTLCLLN